MQKTIKEMSKAYESPMTKNITELEKVNVNLTVEEKEFTKTDGEKFTVNIASLDGEEYRVPNSVLKQLKEQLAEKPEMEWFKVNSSGSGLNTTYTVIPL